MVCLPRQHAYVFIKLKMRVSPAMLQMQMDKHLELRPLHQFRDRLQNCTEAKLIHSVKQTMPAADTRRV